MILLNAFQKGITGALGTLLCYLLFLLYRYDKTLIRKYISFFLTSSLRTPKIFVKEFSYFLMPCHQHCLGVNLLVQRQPNLYGCDCLSQCKDLVYAHLNL